MTAPRVFVSYSHEEKEHDRWVIALAASLRKKGVDATLDTWDLLPGQDATFFMESQIRDSNFVILVCSPTYAAKSNIPKGGVGYEKNIISAEMLQSSDLKPKFIPLLRKGDYAESLPTYLGSKYALDFRSSRNQDDALEELLRAVFGQPHPSKPPLGRNPFEGVQVSQEIAAKSQTTPTSQTSLQTGDIRTWESEAHGRFEFLRAQRIAQQNEDPFTKGYWQGSFVLHESQLALPLTDFLEKLRASETHRTGWDIGWVPTRNEIAPYPFKGGIEVWLAEEGGKGSGHSDFWRAEPSGRFALFRGYQEDDSQFQVKGDTTLLDFSLVLWRVSELLLYMENFAKHMDAPGSAGQVKFHWMGLENRTICYHKRSQELYKHNRCQQDAVESAYEISDCREIRKTLIRDVHRITQPLFVAFNFFSREVNEEYVKQHIKDLFDPEKELKAQQN